MKFCHGPMNSNDVGIETNNGEIGDQDTRN